MPFRAGCTWFDSVPAPSALIKTWAFFYLMLPIKMGLEQVISPFSWGFTFTPALKAGYALTALALMALAGLRRRQRLAVVIGLLAIMLFFGLTRMPWPALWLIMAFVCWQLSGPKLALSVLIGLAYLLLSGIWPQTLLSVYLCGIGVVLSFTLGSALGILASEFKSVSRVLQPINDTLQTMPLFVLLIPFVMIFKIGEFTALLAVMAYAMVPAIRYSEHGLRSVPHEVVEAATCMGCTRWQLLWRVKIPLALPEMMLGLNQTIMFGISMLVIAALVGTSGLGQQVYIGLGDGDFGVGMTAGIGMGYIHSKDGLTSDQLAFVMELKNVRRGRISEAATAFDNITFHEGTPWNVACNVALPCATQNELKGDDAKQLINNGVVALGEGANMPCTPEAVELFHNHGVMFSPGKASNAGGVATSGLEMSQNSLRMNWTREEVDGHLHRIMTDIHTSCVKYGTKKDGSVDYVLGANIAGFVKVADAMLDQGVV